MPFETPTIAMSPLSVAERLLACSMSPVMDRSLDRTRGVVGASSAAGAGRADREQAIVAVNAAQTIWEAERWWTVMASSSPARVVRAFTTGGEKDVETLQDGRKA